MEMEWLNLWFQERFLPVPWEDILGVFVFGVQELKGSLS
jgi:hypothetical protein